MDSLNWLHDLTDSIWGWLLSLRDERHPGMFRFCKAGATFQPSPETGLGTSSLALKVCYQINRLSMVKDSDSLQWIEYIQSFQREAEGKFAGLFEDKELLKVADKNAGWFRQDVATRQAETRQACAALLSAGATPKFPVLGLPDSEPEVLKYFSNLPWNTDPWGAASHVGHLVFFLKLNTDFFERRTAYDELLPVILEKLDSLQEQKTGSWFTGNPSREQKINAAMKILIAYNVVGKSPGYAERLTDLCLEADSSGNACNNVDILYVLYQCSKQTPYRIDDIKTFAGRKLAVINNHRKKDSAFSFFPDRAGEYYYGVRVSRGYPESDIHGTHLLVWALTMIGELLGFNKELGWKLPIT